MSGHHLARPLSPGSLSAAIPSPFETREFVRDVASAAIIAEHLRRPHRRRVVQNGGLVLWNASPMRAHSARAVLVQAEVAAISNDGD